MSLDCWVLPLLIPKSQAYGKDCGWCKPKIWDLAETPLVRGSK